MAKRREVTPVTLTDEQRQRLERLWFHFGNYGEKTTPGNHSFIQRLLENGFDERPLHTKRTPKSQIPTPECVKAVEAVLIINSSQPQEDRTRGLRLIASTTELRRPEPCPELKTLLDDMRRRHHTKREMDTFEDNTPDAA